MLKEKMKSFCGCLTKREFIRYLLVGGSATLIDWSLFYIFAIVLGIYYQVALVISFSISCIFNYYFSRIFTFRSKSQKIFSQFSLFLLVIAIYLSMSIFLMFIFVELILIEKMISKILTTGFMLIVNYLLNKYLTFNKRFFQ